MKPGDLVRIEALAYASYLGLWLLHAGTNNMVEVKNKSIGMVIEAKLCDYPDLEHYIVLVEDKLVDVARHYIKPLNDCDYT